MAILIPIFALIWAAVLPIAALTQTIAQTTTIISLISIALFGLSWVIGSLLKGAPLPWRDWKEFGNGMQMDAVKATFMMALYSSIASLLSFIVNAISSAA